MLYIQFKVVLDNFKKKTIFTSKPLETDLGHACNLSYDFEGDLMIRSGKNKCMCVEFTMGVQEKSNHDAS